MKNLEKKKTGFFNSRWFYLIICGALLIAGSLCLAFLKLNVRYEINNINSEFNQFIVYLDFNIPSVESLIGKDIEGVVINFSGDLKYFEKFQDNNISIKLTGLSFDFGTCCGYLLGVLGFLLGFIFFKSKTVSLFSLILELASSILVTLQFYWFTYFNKDVLYTSLSNYFTVGNISLSVFSLGSIICASCIFGIFIYSFVHVLKLEKR